MPVWAIRLLAAVGWGWWVGVLAVGLLFNSWLSHAGWLGVVVYVLSAVAGAMLGAALGPWIYRQMRAWSDRWS
jgi:hypothetical protein